MYALNPTFPPYSTSESEEPKKSPLKATPPAQVKRQTFSRLTSPFHSTSSEAATFKPSPNGSPAATSKQPNRKSHTNCSPQMAASRAACRTPGAIDTAAADSQLSGAKTSPSPRRIPRLLKPQAHSLTTTTTTKNNGSHHQHEHHPQLQQSQHNKSNGTAVADRHQQQVVEGTRNPCETRNHINQAQHYQQLSANGHHTSNNHRTHNNHIITNHANGNADHAKIKLQNNNRVDMLRSPVFRTPVCASDGDENDF